jgi:hypothetical protein
VNNQNTSTPCVNLILEDMNVLFFDDVEEKKEKSIPGKLIPSHMTVFHISNLIIIVMA